jgi:hypothetical protein
MSEAHPGGCSRSVIGGDSGNLGTGACQLLSLAAAPTFAIMALLTGVPDVSPPVCTAAQHASPLSGMAAMYLLMTVFHSVPWLKLISGRRHRARGA